MTASQKPKTPSMTMRVKRDVPLQDISLFCKRASRVSLSQVVDSVEVRESLRVEGDARRTQFAVDINFYPKSEYQEEHDLEPTEILAAFGVKFPLTLKKEIVAEMKKLDADLKSQITELGKGKKVRGKDGDADEDDEGEGEKGNKRGDDGSEVGDGDADDEKHARQKHEQATYESDDEDDDENIGAYDDAAIEAEYASGKEGEAEGITPPKPAKSTSFKSLVRRASDLFQRNMHQCISFSFDESKCTFTLEVSPLGSALLCFF